MSFRILRGPGAWVAPVAFYLAWALGIYALMPSNPDSVELAEAVVRPFQALSLVGLVVFWAAFALALAYLGRERAGTPG